MNIYMYYWYVTNNIYTLRRVWVALVCENLDVLGLVREKIAERDITGLVCFAQKWQNGAEKRRKMEESIAFDCPTL